MLAARSQYSAEYLIRDTQAYGPLEPGSEDQDLLRCTFGVPVGDEKAFRVCWGLWDEANSRWLNMRGAAVQPKSEWLFFRDVKPGGRYQLVPPEQHGEAKYTVLWKPRSAGA